MTWILQIILLFFLLVSVLFITPTTSRKQSEYRSSQLKKITTQQGNTVRTDYVDKNNQVTIAADLGYATSIITENDNKKVEQFFDDHGVPVRKYNGYYALVREYDEKGNNTKITYLDLDCKPMIIASGYAIEKREYSENNELISVRFFDMDEKPIHTSMYGYGKVNEYNEDGEICNITYIDSFGEPIMTGQGYASIKKCYCVLNESENKIIEKDFYFDESGEPVSLSLGQYGIQMEYDEYGRISVLTYLGAKGNPIITKKGYTTIVRTYHANDTVATEQFYDLGGTPFSLSEGQYGVKKSDNQTFYLDVNGNTFFNLRNLLYNHSWMIIPVVIIAVLLSSVTGKVANAVCLVMYIYVIVYLTIMFREKNSIKGIGFFISYSKILSDNEAKADIIKNLWMFIPLGTILYRLYPRKIILLIPIILSASIEGIQYFSELGFCELDDVFSNSLGGWIGFVAGKLTADLKCRIKNWQHNKNVKKVFP